MKRKLVALERFYGYKMKTREQFIAFVPCFNDSEAKLSVRSILSSKNPISDNPENYEVWYCFSVDIYSGKTIVESKDHKPYKLFDLESIVDEINNPLPVDSSNN